jgi:hypothetical protein
MSSPLYKGCVGGFLFARLPDAHSSADSRRTRVARLVGGRISEAGAVSARTIHSAERAEGVPRLHTETLEKIQMALEGGGIEIIPANVNGGPGVRLRGE